MPQIILCNNNIIILILYPTSYIIMSKTQNEPIEMKENEVCGVSIAALEPERSPQESVLMSRNICYVKIQTNRHCK